LGDWRVSELLELVTSGAMVLTSNSLRGVGLPSADLDQDEPFTGEIGLFGGDMRREALNGDLPVFAVD
jgi:hypothetical protein